MTQYEYLPSDQHLLALALESFIERTLREIGYIEETMVINAESHGNRQKLLDRYNVKRNRAIANRQGAIELLSRVLGRQSEYEYLEPKEYSNDRAMQALREKLTGK